jgi:membrane protein insertase Oxa1/YidC/SpoIIIJ
MWNFLFNELIYRPQLNIVQFLFNATKDIGFTMMFIAIIFNLLAFRWFSKSSLNMQKRLALGQDFKNIQAFFKEKNKVITEKITDLSKDTIKNELEINALKQKQSAGLFDQQKLTKEINKTFNIVGNYQIKTLILQVWISLGLYTIFNDITKTGGRLEGLYPQIWNGATTSDFGSIVKAFGNIEIAKNLWQTGLFWLPVINALFTFLAVYYSFKFTTRAKVRELTEFEKSYKENQKLMNEKDGVPDIDPEKIAAQSQNINLIMVPVMTLVTNFSFPTGLNIYYTFLSFLFLTRTIVVDWYYRNHQYQYMVDINEAGPLFPFEEGITELNKGNYDFSNTQTEILKTTTKI